MLTANNVGGCADLIYLLGAGVLNKKVQVEPRGRSSLQIQTLLEGVIDRVLIDEHTAKEARDKPGQTFRCK